MLICAALFAMENACHPETNARPAVDNERWLVSPESLIKPWGMTSSTNGPEGMKGCFGPFYFFLAKSRGPWQSPGYDRKGEVSIWSSHDDAKLVVVLEGVSIYASTNSGANWDMFTKPGKYFFPISTSPTGISLGPSPTLESNKGATARDESANESGEGWYAIGVAPDGSKLVLEQAATQATPVLSIRRMAGDIVVSWPASDGDFMLQQNNELTATNWVTVTNSAQQVDGRNQVTLSQNADKNFFRLRKRME